jgi:UDP-2,3-diacylglucosamine pyrophosphatase LpxH
MLVVISDLHLQELPKSRVGRNTLEDSTRNVSAEALNLLFEEIHSKVMEQDVEEVVLCLAGDIFEINRSDLWFESGLRPYHDGLPPPELEDVVHRIFDRIIEDNLAFFQTLADFVLHKRFTYQGKDRQIAQGIALKVRFMPGNHDRLLNAWPSLRARVRTLLNVAGADEEFEHEFLFETLKDRPSYGVLVRHGHEYDETNFAQSAPKEAGLSRYNYACLGDVVTLELVSYFPYRFHQLYELILAGSNHRSKFYRQLYSGLVDFDDVRPATALFGYLMAYLKSAKSKAREMELEERAIDLLRPILREAFDAVAKLKFIRKEAKSIPLRLMFLPPGRYIVQACLRWLPAKMLNFALNQVGNLRSKVEASRPATFAAKEKSLITGRVHTIVAGHTHHPDQVPLRDGDQFFLDSGTWRTLIYQGEEAKVFGRLRAITYIFCYRSDEGHSNRRFESWTGHLSSERHKSYQTPAVSALGEVS